MSSSNGPIHSQWVISAMSRFEGSLTLYASRLLGDVERGRDVVQETFLRLCSQEPSSIEPFLAEWLFTVCRNQALDVRRKESRMKTLEESQIESKQSLELAPLEAAERRESFSLVLQALKKLPENQQEVIRLKFQHDLSYRQISGVTGLTVSNVGFLMHTGLKAIRQQMGQQAVNDSPGANKLFKGKEL